MQRRTMGKAAFANILDSSGSIQIYIKLDNIGKETYDEFLDYDIGDIVGVEGTVFKTHKGEISVNVSKILLLSKSLSPLPEKFHGLKDVDLRYRKRYLDLIMDENVKKTFIKRSIIIKTIRVFKIPTKASKPEESEYLLNKSSKAEKYAFSSSFLTPNLSESFSIKS